MTVKNMNDLFGELNYIPDLNPFFERSDEDIERAEQLFHLGEQYEKGDGLVHKDSEKAFLIYEELADKNYVPALNKIGEFYQDKKNYSKALRNYLKAADLGDSDALFNIGAMYEFNLFGYDEIDWKKAAGYYHKSALLGNPKGLFNYANCLHYGNGIKRDRELAYYLFNQAAHRGDNDAWFYIGLYYQEGYVVKKDIEEAKYYYKKGAAFGDPYCFTNLGKIYADEGYNYEEAAKYYLDALARGDALGYAGIAKLYEDGHITSEKDKKTAVKWYQLAVENGFDDALDELARLNTKHNKKIIDDEIGLRAECLYSLKEEEWRDEWLNNLRKVASYFLKPLSGLWYFQQNHDHYSAKNNVGKDVLVNDSMDETDLSRYYANEIIDDFIRIGFISPIGDDAVKIERRVEGYRDYEKIMSPIEAKRFNPDNEWPSSVNEDYYPWYLDKAKIEYIQYFESERSDPWYEKVAATWSSEMRLLVNGKEVKVNLGDSAELSEKYEKMLNDHIDEFEFVDERLNQYGRYYYTRKK